MSKPRPRIALTPGEPAGIGLDICLMLAQHAQACELIVIADPDLLDQRARQLDLPVSLHICDRQQTPQSHLPGHLWVDPIPCPEPVHCGKLNPANAGYVLQTLERASKLCLDSHCDAITTGPVQKSVINEAGIHFSGHTEFFAEHCGGYPVMMLASSQLRVALATTHLPLSQVSQAITSDRLKRIIEILHHDLQNRFGLPAPRIAVCGLNPHAGEGGHLGREEIEIIEPTLKSLRETGIHLTGPLPADTVFTPPVLKEHDVVLAMYHDQGLPTLKYVGFGDAVNITLGLPIIRTSVDHGTALSLAGTGHAKIGSLQAAIEAATQMVQSRLSSE